MPEPLDFVPLAVAASRLGQSEERVRQRLRAADELVGLQEIRGHHRWLVDTNSLEKLLERSGREPTPSLAALAADVGRLRDEVEALKLAPAARVDDRSDSADALERERDHYRAEAAAMREVALRANAWQRAALEGFRGLLEALEAQTDALGELLGPRHPGDL